MDRGCEGRRWSGAFSARGCAVLLACIGVALALGVVAHSTAGPAPSFARPANYPTGRHPSNVAIGDLNGDSKPDLATANSDANTVSVLLNRGGGGFAGKRDYVIGRLPVTVAISDLNGDGKPDLATANINGNVSVLLNKGDGSFEARRNYATGSSSVDVAIGDLDGDAKPDLVTANQVGNSVSVLLNRGDGSFGASVNYSTGVFAISVAIGDVNGDGKQDLATANFEGSTVSVLLNRGDGTFRARRDFLTGEDPVSVAIGDLNGDGAPELVTANDDFRSETYTVAVFINKGGGGFAGKRNYATGRRPSSVAIGDMNGDGKRDLVTANGYANTVSVLLNRGDGGFAPKLDYQAGRSLWSWQFSIGDLNADRKPDLVTANARANTVSVLINKPGLCNVQYVVRKTLAAARQMLARANCHIGAIHRAYSKTFKRGRVIAQKPSFGAVLPRGGRVNLVVSRGR